MPSSTKSSTSSSSAKSSSSSAPPEKLLPLLHAKLRKLLLRSQSANITDSNPIVKGTYLGNVITTFPKGNGSLERPASTLWKNHIQGRGSIRMTVTVCPAGLQAETREHGLTEYWNNRLTWCGVPHDYPKLFCWIYRHEGRKMKQELRCHAVLCGKDEAKILSETLRNRLAEALFDFRKEKIQRQNARLACLENYLNYYTNSESLSNYKKEKTSPSKLSIIEELEEEALLPDLVGFDKVLHLLKIEIDDGSSMEGNEQSHELMESESPNHHQQPVRTNSLTSNDSSSDSILVSTDEEEGNSSSPPLHKKSTVIFDQISYDV